MPKLIINGLVFSYDVKTPENPAQAIIFVHGAGNSKNLWFQQMNIIGQDTMAIAIDLPGHGESAGQPCGSISEYSDYIYDFAEHVLGCPFILAGHSMGGAIAIDFALRYPNQCKGLILIGTGARLRVASSILNVFASGRHLETLTDYAFGPDSSQELLIQYRQNMLNTEPIVFFKDFSACNQYDNTDQIIHIDQPTLIIGASHDQMTPLKYSEFLAQKIKHSTLAIIEGAGHMMMLEKPNEVNQKIAQFLDSFSS